MLNSLEREAAIRHIMTTIGAPVVNDIIVASFTQAMRYNRNLPLVDALCECIREMAKRSQKQVEVMCQSTGWTKKPAPDSESIRRSLLEAARRINESTNSMLPKKHRDFFVDTLADAMTDMPPPPKPEAANELDGMPMPEFIDKCL